MLQGQKKKVKKLIRSLLEKFLSYNAKHFLKPEWTMLRWISHNLLVFLKLRRWIHLLTNLKRSRTFRSLPKRKHISYKHYTRVWIRKLSIVLVCWLGTLNTHWDELRMAKEEAINQIVTRINEQEKWCSMLWMWRGWTLHIRGCGHITYKLVVIGYENVNVMFEQVYLKFTYSRNLIKYMIKHYFLNSINYLKDNQSNSWVLKSNQEQ